MKKSVMLLLVLCLSILMTSCGKPSKTIVTKYFQAMQGNDRETMQSMSADPKDLEFKAYEITATSEPVIGKSQLPEFVKELEDIKKQMQEQANKTMEIKDDVLDLEDELADTRSARKKRALRTKLDDAKKQLTEAEQTYKDFFPKRNAAKKNIQLEKSYITLSTGQQDNIESFEGDTQGVIVTVKVTLTDDQVVDYEFTLRRYIFKRNETELTNRFIIIKIDAKE